MKKEIMKRAWRIASIQSKLNGGTKKEWIAFGLTRAWDLFKNGELVQTVTQPKPATQKLQGGMTSKQDWFITKLMKEVEALGIDVINEVPGVIEYLQQGIYGTSKQEASELINELLNTKKAVA